MNVTNTFKFELAALHISVLSGYILSLCWSEIETEKHQTSEYWKCRERFPKFNDFSY